MVADATNRPDAGDILRLAFETVNARGADYDKTNDIDQNFREAAAIASVILGKDITPRDVSMILVCVKLIRAKSAPGKLDNYVDAVNYMAFSACFAGLVPLPPLVKEIKKPQDVTHAANQVSTVGVNAVNQRGAA